MFQIFKFYKIINRSKLEVFAIFLIENFQMGYKMSNGQIYKLGISKFHNYDY